MTVVETQWTSYGSFGIGMIHSCSKLELLHCCTIMPIPRCRSLYSLLLRERTLTVVNFVLRDKMLTN